MLAANINYIKSNTHTLSIKKGRAAIILIPQQEPTTLHTLKLAKWAAKTSL